MANTHEAILRRPSSLSAAEHNFEPSASGFGGGRKKTGIGLHDRGGQGGPPEFPIAEGEFSEPQRRAQVFADVWTAVAKPEQEAILNEQFRSGRTSFSTRLSMLRNEGAPGWYGEQKTKLNRLTFSFTSLRTPVRESLDYIHTLAIATSQISANEIFPLELFGIHLRSEKLGLFDPNIDTRKIEDAIMGRLQDMVTGKIDRPKGFDIAEASDLYRRFIANREWNLRAGN